MVRIPVCVKCFQVLSCKIQLEEVVIRKVNYTPKPENQYGQKGHRKVHRH
jgi:hypothetical protein